MIDGSEILEDQIPDEPKQPALEPSLVKTSSLHADLTLPESQQFEPLEGEYHLVSIDAMGNDVQGSDFSIGDPTYTQVFLPLLDKSFRLKKKPTN